MCSTLVLRSFLKLFGTVRKSPHKKIKFTLEITFCIKKKKMVLFGLLATTLSLLGLTSFNCLLTLLAI
jgi:hypothetical protein